MDKTELTKKYNTWVKGSVGTVSLMFILSLIYFLRALTSKAPDFWFNLSVFDLLMKNTSHFEGYNGTLPLWVAIVVSAVVLAIGMLFTALANKKTKNLVFCLIYFLIDSGILAYIMIANPFNDVNENMYIGVLTHIFVIVYVLVGLYADKKKKELGIN